MKVSISIIIFFIEAIIVSSCCNKIKKADAENVSDLNKNIENESPHFKVIDASYYEQISPIPNVETTYSFTTKLKLLVDDPIFDSLIIDSYKYKVLAVEVNKITANPSFKINDEIVVSASVSKELYDNISRTKPAISLSYIVDKKYTQDINFQKKSKTVIPN